MTLLYGAGACLVLAQIIGIYALVTHKADVIFSVGMIGLLVAAAVLGGLGVYQQLA